MNSNPVEPDIPKAEWGDGPWQQEPDREDFEFAGFPCLALRNYHGSWCGYVGVPPGHPAHGVPYDDVDVNVHGGLTYSNRCQEPICHSPKPGESDDVWWLGFDCGHGFDFIPGLVAVLKTIGVDHYSYGEVYRDLNYVKAEIRSLAEQLRVADGRE
jgi:hypothetical protein